MSEFKVSWEIDIEANSPLEAANFAQEMLDESSKWQFFVQNEETKEIFTVDHWTDKFSVLPVTNYTPFIVQK